MKKIFYPILCIALLSACKNSNNGVTTDAVNNPNSANETYDSTMAPVMTFPEVLFDFGDITQGEKVNHQFKFTNTGKTDLIITSAQGSCGCTIPKWPKEPIAPGKEGVIDVVFDSSGKKGHQNKKVTIVANSQPSTNVVAFSGNVIAPAETEEKK